MRCGDAVDITAVATTTSAGGNTGGPSTSNSRSATPVPSSMTIAADCRRARRAPRPDARTRSRVKREAAADDGGDEEHQRPRHRHPEHQPPQRVEEPGHVGHHVRHRLLDTRRAAATPAPAMTTTSALMMATTTSVGRRARGSSCADANNCRPARSHSAWDAARRPCRLSGGFASTSTIVVDRCSLEEFVDGRLGAVGDHLGDAAGAEAGDRARGR